MPRTPHVAEPWEVSHRAKAGEDAVIAAKNRPLTICQVHDFGAESMEHTTAEANANANRIVACVNALAGVKDPAAAISDVRATIRGAIEWANDRGYATDDQPWCALSAALASLGG